MLAKILGGVQGRIDLMTRYLSGVLGLALGAALLVATPDRAQAQAWPTRPVTIIVPFAPGGNTDTMARLLANKLGEKFGQNFIVENRVGASGAIGTAAVARAAPDGYTLMFGAVQQISVLPITDKVNYDPKTDLSYISIFGEGPFVLGVNVNRVPAKTLPEFLAFARNKPEPLTYASGGANSISHLVPALMFERAKAKVIHVPYRGGAPAVTDLVGGHVDVYFGNASELMNFASDPKIRILAVSSEARMPQLPDVQTLGEIFPGFTMTTWNGLMAPAKISPDIFNKLALAAREAANDPAVKKTLTELGITPVGGTPEEFTKRVASEGGLLLEAIKAANTGNP